MDTLSAIQIYQYGIGYAIILAIIWYLLYNSWRV